MRLLAKVFHVRANQHLAQLHEVAVILVLHCQSKGGREGEEEGGETGKRKGEERGKLGEEREGRVKGKRGEERGRGRKEEERRVGVENVMRNTEEKKTVSVSE